MLNETLSIRKDYIRNIKYDCLDRICTADFYVPPSFEHTIKDFIRSMYSIGTGYISGQEVYFPRSTFTYYPDIRLTTSIKKVIFNPPATIMFFDDGTKVVVKCMEGDKYDPDVGMAMCISKKILGTKFSKTFKDFTKEWKDGNEN